MCDCRLSWASFLLIQVSKAEGQGAMRGKKRQLSRRELEEELQNVQRMNHKFYRFAVEELIKEVNELSEGNGS